MGDLPARDGRGRAHGSCGRLTADAPGTADDSGTRCEAPPRGREGVMPMSVPNLVVNEIFGPT